MRRTYPRLAVYFTAACALCSVSWAASPPYGLSCLVVTDNLDQKASGWKVKRKGKAQNELYVVDEAGNLISRQMANRKEFGSVCGTTAAGGRSTAFEKRYVAVSFHGASGACEFNFTTSNGALEHTLLLSPVGARPFGIKWTGFCKIVPVPANYNPAGIK